MVKQLWNYCTSWHPPIQSARRVQADHAQGLAGVIRQGEVVRAMVDLVLEPHRSTTWYRAFCLQAKSGMMSFDLPAQTRLLSVNLNGKAVRVSQESPRAIDIMMSPGDDSETIAANNGDRDRPAHDESCA